MSSKKGGSVPIPVGPFVRYASYFAFFIFTLLALFGVAYGNVQTFEVATISLVFVVGGYYIAKTSGNWQTLKASTEKRRGGKILRGIAISFVGVATGDVAVIPAFGLLGPAFGTFAGIFTQSVLPPETFFSIGVLVALLTAISETMLIIVGFANWFLRRAGFLLGMVAVFILAFLIHIPVDGFDWPTLTAIGLGFSIQALGGIYAGDAAVPMGVHIVNNAAAIGLFALLLMLGVVH